jgi:hypothetical protein
MQGSRSTRRERAALTVWVAAVAISFLAAGRYATSQAESGAVVPRWPAETSLAAPIARPRLVVFLHPLCPCSRATIAELEQVLARAPDRADASFLLVWEGDDPPGDPIGHLAAVESLARSTASSTVEGAVRLDVRGLEARRFGAVTSGEILLFGSDGSLRFHGGITRARGHVGANDGADALVEILLGRAPGRIEFPVFGCPLFSAAAAAAEAESGVRR